MDKQGALWTILWQHYVLFAFVRHVCYHGTLQFLIAFLKERIDNLTFRSVGSYHPLARILFNWPFEYSHFQWIEYTSNVYTFQE